MEETSSLVLLHGQAVVLQEAVLVSGFGEPDTCIVDHDVAVESCNDAVSVLWLAVCVGAALRLLLTGPVVDGFCEEDRATRHLRDDPLQLLRSGAVGQLANEDTSHALLGRRGVVNADVLHGGWVRNEVQATLEFLVESASDDHILALGGGAWRCGPRVALHEDTGRVRVMAP